jgi:hypothetical protein
VTVLVPVAVVGVVLLLLLLLFPPHPVRAIAAAPSKIAKEANHKAKAAGPRQLAANLPCPQKAA